MVLAGGAGDLCLGVTPVGGSCVGTIPVGDSCVGTDVLSCVEFSSRSRIVIVVRGLTISTFM